MTSNQSISVANCSAPRTRVGNENMPPPPTLDAMTDNPSQEDVVAPIKRARGRPPKTRSKITNNAALALELANVKGIKVKQVSSKPKSKAKKIAKNVTVGGAPSTLFSMWGKGSKFEKEEEDNSNTVVASKSSTSLTMDSEPHALEALEICQTQNDSVDVEVIQSELVTSTADLKCGKPIDVDAIPDMFLTRRQRRERRVNSSRRALQVELDERRQLEARFRKTMHAASAAIDINQALGRKFTAAANPTSGESVAKAKKGDIVKNSSFDSQSIRAAPYPIYTHTRQCNINIGKLVDVDMGVGLCVNADVEAGDGSENVPINATNTLWSLCWPISLDKYPRRSRPTSKHMLTHIKWQERTPDNTNVVCSDTTKKRTIPFYLMDIYNNLESKHNASVMNRSRNIDRRQGNVESFNTTMKVLADGYNWPETYVRNKITSIARSVKHHHNLEKVRRLDADRSMTWAAKFRPTCAGQVVGKANSYSAQYIIAWLKEWNNPTISKMTSHTQTLRAKRVKRNKISDCSDSESCQDDRLPEPQVSFDPSLFYYNIDPIVRKRRTSMDDFIVSDEDFIEYSEDSSDERNCARSTRGRGNVRNPPALHTVMALFGPSGSGKTASVYACAQELNMQVIEINASMRRSGRTVMEICREATQSRILYTKRNSNGILDEINSMTTSRTNADNNNKKDSLTRAGVGSAINISEDIEDGQKNSKSLKKAIILLKDVDVVFESNDRGFWDSVLSLANSTRTPIILTLSRDSGASAGVGAGEWEENLHSQLRYLPCHFERPSVSELGLYCHGVCASYGMSVNPSEIKRLIQHTRRDIRRTLNTLQFWLQQDPTKSTISHKDDITTNSISNAKSIGIENGCDYITHSQYQSTSERESHTQSDSLSQTNIDVVLGDSGSPIVKNTPIVLLSGASSDSGDNSVVFEVPRVLVQKSLSMLIQRLETYTTSKSLLNLLQRQRTRRGHGIEEALSVCRSIRVDDRNCVDWVGLCVSACRDQLRSPEKRAYEHTTTSENNRTTNSRYMVHRTEQNTTCNKPANYKDRGNEISPQINQTPNVRDDLNHLTNNDCLTNNGDCSTKNLASNRTISRDVAPIQNQWSSSVDTLQRLCALVDCISECETLSIPAQSPWIDWASGLDAAATSNEEITQTGTATDTNNTGAGVSLWVEPEYTDIVREHEDNIEIVDTIRILCAAYDLETCAHPNEKLHGYNDVKEVDNPIAVLSLASIDQAKNIQRSIYTMTTTSYRLDKHVLAMDHEVALRYIITAEALRKSLNTKRRFQDYTTSRLSLTKAQISELGTPRFSNS
eukprot:CFRG1964T1